MNVLRKSILRLHSLLFVGLLFAAVLFVGACSSSDPPIILIDNDEETNDGNDEEPPCLTELTPEGICLPRAPDTDGDHECPSGEYRANPHLEGPGICLPQRPQGTSGPCPSGEYVTDERMSGGGICLADRPKLSDWSCAENWEPRELTDSTEQSLSVCVPPALDESCGDGLWRSPREGECVSHGLPCPQGEGWPAESVIADAAQGFDGDLHYVDLSGDDNTAAGTRDAPYVDVDSALQSAQSGDIIALASGTYDQTIRLEESVALIGACVADTIIDPAESGTAIELVADGSTHLAHLSIAAGTTGISITNPHSGATATVDSVRVEGDVSVFADGNSGEVEFRDLVIDEEEGFGLSLTGDGKAKLQGGWIHSPDWSAIDLSNSYEFEATDLFVARGGSQYSAAITVDSGSELDLRRAHLVGAEGRGALDMSGWGTQSRLEDVYVTAHDSAVGDPALAGVVVFAGAHLEAERLLIDGLGEHSLLNGLFLQDDAQATVEDVAVTGLSRRDDDYVTAITALFDSTLNLERAALLSQANTSIYLDDSFLSATDVVVDPVAAQGSAEQFQYGVQGFGSTFNLSRIDVAEAQICGISVTMESVLNGQDLTMHWPNQPDGRATSQECGIGFQDGAGGDLGRIHFDRPGSSGIQLGVDGGDVELRDLAIRDLRAYEQWVAPDLVSSGGLWIKGGNLDVRNFIISDNAGAAMTILGQAELTLEDGLIRDVAPEVDSGLGGLGALISGGADAELRRLAFYGMYMAGIHIGEPLSPGTASTTAVVEDLRLSQVEPMYRDDTDGRGMQIGAAEVEGHRWWIDQTHAGGITAFGFDAEVDLRDLLIEDVEGQRSDNGAGSGLFASSDVSVALQRALVSRATFAGVMAFGDDHPSEFTATDLVVEKTRPSSAVENSGLGLSFTGDIVADVDRVVLSDNPAVGLMTTREANADLRDLTVTGTSGLNCPVENCDEDGGVGVVSTADSRLSLSRFVVERSRLSGFHLIDQARIHARDGIIRNNSIGINFELEDFDIDEHFDTVFLDGNSQDIASTQIPVPSVADIIEETP